MNQNFVNEFKPKCNFTLETLLAFISVPIMWVCYYVDNSGIVEDNLIWSLFWGFGIIVGLNVCFPAWWIIRKKQEGLAGMGVTKNNLGLALLFSVALALIRMPDLIKFSAGLSLSALLPVIIFNLVSIWEVCFLYSWLYTRFTKAFGKGLAAVLTSLSVGLYHCGSLKVEQILTLMTMTFLCALCFAVTDNIFTLWPVYWIIGCSASVIKAYGASSFPWEMTGLMGIVLIVQLIILFFIIGKRKR